MALGACYGGRQTVQLVTIMPTPPRRPRVIFTPSDALLKLLQELAELSDSAVGTVAGDLLEEAAPVIRGQLDAMRAIRDRPGQMEAYLTAYANQAVNEIAQTVMDLKPAHGNKGRVRNAKPKP